MAKRVQGVTERLLESAKTEFLKNGYENASLQAIAERAGSSKGAIYIRYPDKGSLYRALVEPAADGLCELLRQGLSRFQKMPGPAQQQEITRFSDDGFPAIIAYLYDHFDAFKLLLTSGESKTFQTFLHRMIDLDVACTMQYLQQTGNDALAAGRLTPELAHLLSSAFFSGMFEVVIHDMTREQAVEHIQRMRRFYRAGWDTILQPGTP